MDPFVQEFLERLDAKLRSNTNTIRSLNAKLDDLLAGRTSSSASLGEEGLDSTPSSTDHIAVVYAPVASSYTGKLDDLIAGRTPSSAPPGEEGFDPAASTTTHASPAPPTTAEEVHDSNTATAVCLDLAIDLNTTTALGPEPVVDLCNTTAAIEVGTCGHGDKFSAFNIPVTVSISPLLHV